MRFAASGEEQRPAAWFAAPSGEEEEEEPTCRLELVGHTHNLSCVSFAPDSKVVITGSEDKTARIWSVETGECLQLLKGHTAKLGFVRLAPTSRPQEWQAITGSFDCDIRCWNTATGECERITSVSGWATAMSYVQRGELKLLAVRYL